MIAFIINNSFLHLRHSNLHHTAATTIGATPSHRTATVARIPRERNTTIATVAAEGHSSLGVGIGGHRTKDNTTLTRIWDRMATTTVAGITAGHIVMVPGTH